MTVATRPKASNDGRLQRHRTPLHSLASKTRQDARTDAIKARPGPWMEKRVSKQASSDFHGNYEAQQLEPEKKEQEIKEKNKVDNALLVRQSRKPPCTTFLFVSPSVLVRVQENARSNACTQHAFHMPPAGPRQLMRHSPRHSAKTKKKKKKSK